MGQLVDEYTITSRMPTVEEYSALRAAVEWSIPDTEGAQNALDNSVYGCCLMDGESVIGMCRVVGDGTFYFYLQDLIIHPDFQHKGCGRQLLNHTMKHLAQNTSSGAFIGIFSGHDIDSIMAKYSFLKDSFLHMSKGMFFIKK